MKDSRYPLGSILVSPETKDMCGARWMEEGGWSGRSSLLVSHPCVLLAVTKRKLWPGSGGVSSPLWRQTGLVCLLIPCPGELKGFVCVGWELPALLPLIGCSFAPASKISLLFCSLLHPISRSSTPAPNKPVMAEGSKCRVFQIHQQLILCQAALCFSTVVCVGHGDASLGGQSRASLAGIQPWMALSAAFNPAKQCCVSSSRLEAAAGWSLPCRDELFHPTSCPVRWECKVPVLRAAGGLAPSIGS